MLQLKKMKKKLNPNSIGLPMIKWMNQQKTIKCDNLFYLSIIHEKFKKIKNFFTKEFLVCKNIHFKNSILEEL